MKLTSGQKINIFGITICSVIVFFFIEVYEIQNDERANLESFAGKTIVIGKDTLIVTDYNGSNGTYNLSNRVIVDEKYILKNAK